MTTIERAYRAYDPAVDEFAPDGYPKAWHAILKHEVRTSAGNRCLRCGHPYQTGQHPMEPVPGGKVSWSPCDTLCLHGGAVRMRQGDRWVETILQDGTIPSLIEDGIEVDAAWRILTVHHLDLDKANCRWWNLASLCQRCHLQIQRKVVMQRVWPWEHSDWFKPYAAGFYAWAYLGEDLTRDEVQARLDELLALELQVM